MDEIIYFLIGKIMIPFLVIASFIFIFIVIPIGLYQCWHEHHNCLKWERTMVNHPAHWSGKIHMPESVEIEDICVKVKP